MWPTIGQDPVCGSGGGGGGGDTLTVGTTVVLGGIVNGPLFANSGLLGEMTSADATAFIDVFTSSLPGAVPASGGGVTNFLRADGTWATPPGGGGSGSITINSGTGVGLTAPGTIPLGGTGVIGAITDVPRFAGINVPIIKPNTDSTTAVQITNAAGTNQVVRVDTTNNRVGINKTPGAFDFDVNGAFNTGGVLTFGTLSSASLGTSPSTITGLVANNTPNNTNDYILYFSAADNAIRKCQIGVCSTSGVAGVASLNGITGPASVLAGAGLTATVAAPNVTVALSAARQTLPNVQAFTFGTNATYTTPAGALWIRIKIWGGGGGGGGGGLTQGNGSNGLPSCLNTSSPACTTPVLSAGGGNGGTVISGFGGTGGTVTGSGTCNELAVTGGSGGPSSINVNNGAAGGDSPVLGGGGRNSFASIGQAAISNTGGGGQGGGWSTVNSQTGPGGGSGAYCETIINSPVATYTYTVGTGGGGGTGSDFAGGNGAVGRIIFEAHFGS
ncbi:MAG TPA: hypothetical protein VH187_05590 [Scandinavium sp.]|uniref:hypothetical protein n=1 Tax=Scandinavium sp. TaxID=2830653 RepID=UPI002E3236AA|nr:hypothetical protein [Scandinavium sp.]HEX4500634.1 hypothetical protein [Scandinavium sp.]